MLEEQGINEVMFFTSAGTVTFVSHVPNMFLNKRKVDDFVQVLNAGRYQLLKYAKKELAMTDSGFLYKRYYFSKAAYYFLKNMQKVERIRKLDDKIVLSYLAQSHTFTDWIKTNHIDLSREKDIVLFLNHYNATYQKKD